MKNHQHTPLIGAETHLPEITIKAIFLSIILTMFLAASNAYLGLKVGLTISTSIPAAVIAMGVLRLFKKHNVLENTMIQTAASCGQSAVSGIIYTIPALILIHYWLHFDYLYTTVIAIVGGLLGVLFNVPLRRVLLADKTLTFPEGVAIGNVLQISARGAGLRYLVEGGIAGAAIAFCQNGLQIFSETVAFWFNSARSVFGISLGFTPALIGAGYIIGTSAGVSILVGIVLGWILGIPLLTFFLPHPEQLSGAALAMWEWSHHVRYIGIGTIMLGGIWTIITLFKPLMRGMKVSFQSISLHRTGGLLRTEKDIPLHVVGVAFIFLLIPIAAVLSHIVLSSHLPISGMSQGILLFFLMALIVVFGFIVAALCGYFGGLVGASSAPLSSMAIASMLVTCLVMLAALHGQLNFSTIDFKTLAAIAIVTVAVIAGGGSIACDTSQDLKAGQMVGATPWKQQVMLMVGLIAGSLVVAPILDLLFNAYGIGGIFPRAGMDPKQMLGAPQATLLMAITQGMFGGELPWGMIAIGMIIAVICITLNETLIKPRGKSFISLAVGIGIYLPMSTTTCLVIGSMISYLVKRRQEQWKKTNPAKAEHKIQFSEQRSILLSSGIVAGATLMGVFLAIPFVIYKSSDALAIMPSKLSGLGDLLGVVSGLVLCIWLFRVACHAKHEKI